METKVLNQDDKSSNSPTFRYAIIGGGGGIAETHLKALAELPAAQVVALADVNPERAEMRAAELGCPFFADHRDMLKQVKPDIAVVCTPHPSHAAG